MMKQRMDHNVLPVKNQQTLLSITKNNGCQYFQDGTLISENTESFWWLSSLYSSWWGKALKFLCTKRFAAQLVGWYMASSTSKKKIVPFVRKHNIVLDDFVEPAGGYQSFNDFFIRKIKPGKRIVDQSENSIVSPADAKILAFQNVSENISFFVKNEQFDLGQFLQNPVIAREFAGGSMLIFRLAPYDYHRFHVPIDCKVDSIKVISGKYNSVNPFVYASGVQPLTSNLRHLITLQSQQLGKVLMIPVGAMFVGSIIETCHVGKQYHRGAEAGYFQFGGSSVVLLFRKDTIKISQQFLKTSAQGYETQVLMGQKIGALSLS